MMNQGTIQKSWGRRKPDVSSVYNVENTAKRLPLILGESIKKSYFENFMYRGERESNLTILDLKTRLGNIGISLSDNDKRLAEVAKDRAEIAQKIHASLGNDATLHYVTGLSVDLPAGKTIESQILRIKDSQWWGRRLRTLQIRSQETIAREFGVVHKKANVYVSDSAVARIEARRARSWDILKTMEAVNCDDENERLNMHDIAMKSIANPENRRNELMVRASGFDEYCRLKNHVCDFYTMTCPSKYHAYKHYGKPNNKYQGFTPRQAQKYLTKIWSRIRSKLDRNELSIYGLRVVEPHHDGTPHWHLLIYSKKVDRQKIRSIIRSYTIKEDRGELANNVDARYLVKGINFGLQENGIMHSGASYIMKYISKNIMGLDSGDVKDFETGTDSKKTAGRVSVWASVWGIRQFQQLGGGSITIWRELRKVRDLKADLVEKDLFELWNAADSNKWRIFCTLLGGCEARRSDQTAGLYKEINKPDVRETQVRGTYDNPNYKVWDLSLNKYEEARELILGVESLNGILLTREKQWRIEKMQGVENSPLGVL